MKYEFSQELQEKANEIMKSLNLSHIQEENIACIKSYGTSTRRTIARCHALGKIMQKALGRKAFYVLEFISERFDRMNEKDKIKTIIHELMHIPKSFGGGFKHHDYVTEENIESLYRKYICKNENFN